MNWWAVPTLVVLVESVKMLQPAVSLSSGAASVLSSVCLTLSVRSWTLGFLGLCRTLSSKAPSLPGHLLSFVQVWLLETCWYTSNPTSSCNSYVGVFVLRSLSLCSLPCFVSKKKIYIYIYIITLCQPSQGQHDAGTMTLPITYCGRCCMPKIVYTSPSLIAPTPWLLLSLCLPKYCITIMYHNFEGSAKMWRPYPPPAHIVLIVSPVHTWSRVLSFQWGGLWSAAKESSSCQPGGELPEEHLISQSWHLISQSWHLISQSWRAVLGGHRGKLVPFLP